MNRLYRVWAKFEPDFVNPLTGRRGQWRVKQCVNNPMYTLTAVIDPLMDELGVLSTKRYQRGSIIRPHVELRRVLAARKAAV